MAHSRSGFTLLELSIVIVIIGLIIGGVLVGRDLINASELRAQITQIEQYQRAVALFMQKYNALPGDMNAATASNYGFTPRGQYAGEGDGNGVIEGVGADLASTNKGFYEATGETAMFWVDLSYANGLNVGLIDGMFNTGSPNTVPGANVTGANIGLYMPPAKLGIGNYVYVWSYNSENYFGISFPSTLFTMGPVISSAKVPVQQAFAIDKKIDDGLPQSGAVMALYNNNGIQWAAAGGIAPPAYTTATQGSSTTCFDNNNTDGNPQQYSTAQSQGIGNNCALSFKFQ